jgi:hypothetical protein
MPILGLSMSCVNLSLIDNQTESSLRLEMSSQNKTLYSNHSPQINCHMYAKTRSLPNWFFGEDLLVSVVSSTKLIHMLLKLIEHKGRRYTIFI